MSEEEAGIKINISASGKDCPADIKGLTHVIKMKEGKNPLVGKKVGDVINGTLIGLPGYELKITGGSDDSGIPLRPDVHGLVKKRLLLAGGVGYNPQKRGERKRKIIRGNEITDNVSQINTIVVKFGKEKIFKKEGAAAEGEAKAEAKEEAAPKEAEKKKTSKKK